MIYIKRWQSYHAHVLTMELVDYRYDKCTYACVVDNKY